MLLRGILPTAQGVSAGGDATIEMILGQRVWSTTLILGDGGNCSKTLDGAAAAAFLDRDSFADTAAYWAANPLTQAEIGDILDAMISGISVKLNSKDQRQRLLPSRINELNGINGVRYEAITSGLPGHADFRIYLTSYFAEFWRKSNNEVPALAWNLNKKGGPAYTDGKSYGDISSCQIHVFFNDTVTWNDGSVNAITGLSLTGNYLWDPADLSRGIGSINKWVTNDLQAAGTKNDFKIDMVQIIQSIHIWPTGEKPPNYVNYFRLNASGTDVQDRLSYQENQAIMYALELNPDTSAYPRFDFIADIHDPILQALPAAAQSSLRMYLEYSASADGNLSTVIQRIGLPD